MIKIDYSKRFDKQFEKLPSKQQKQARAAVATFLQNPNFPTLRNHALQGEWLGHHSISAGGDLRLHYRSLDSQTVIFVAVGTHSQLYN